MKTFRFSMLFKSDFTQNYTERERRGGEEKRNKRLTRHNLTLLEPEVLQHQSHIAYTVFLLMKIVLCDSKKTKKLNNVQCTKRIGK